MLVENYFIECAPLPDSSLVVKVAEHRGPVVAVVDANVYPHHRDAIHALGRSVEVVILPAGERYKNRKTKETIENGMLARGYGRDTLLIAVGGGVTLDLVGFVAATYMRGIEYVSVPTTLLAMVDAAIGGKTGINTPAGKNLIGAFYPPTSIIIDPVFLSSLPHVEWLNGYVEMLKHGVVADRAYFDSLDWGRLLVYPQTLLGAIERSIDIKSSIVADDAHELGRRAVLNFGHTVGHAIEQAKRYRIAHGRAVAVGMMIEGMIAVKIGLMTDAAYQRMMKPIRAVKLDRLPALDSDALLSAMACDKKNRGGVIRMALPTRIGQMARDKKAWTVPVEQRVIRDLLKRI